MEDQDPSKFRSEKANRGPLGKEWRKTTQPMMCCYKLVMGEFKWFGLQNKVEKFIQHAEQRIFFIFHRQIFCWMDKWYGLTMEDIRNLEEKTKKELDDVTMIILFVYIFLTFLFFRNATRVKFVVLALTDLDK